MSCYGKTSQELESGGKTGYSSALPSTWCGQTSKVFNVSITYIYKWAAALAQGQAGDLLQDKDKEILRLQREIQAYKEIIADKELFLRIKDTLLKKSL